MKIKVISLGSSTQRRNSIETQFARLNTEFQFFDAITPDRALGYIQGYNEREFVINSGRLATKTEIACYASHLALWRRCARENAPYLILEDDAKLTDSFLVGMLVVSSQISRLGFIRMSVPNLSTSVVVQKLGPFNVHFCRRVPLRALGYAISPRTASQLVRCGETVEEPVDKYLQRYWRHEQPVFAIEPSVVRLGEHAAESDIGARSKVKSSPSRWLRRAARKSQNSIARTLYAARILSSPAH